jgi:methyltransferase (TIGR00027 family)
MSSEQPLTGVGKTALGVAAVRARESRRSDRLFHDPYAQAFIDAAKGAFPDEREIAATGPRASWAAACYFNAVLRTRFFDDYLRSATSAGCRQVVLLAAGLDTRAFRLSWPERTHAFELDFPGVLAFKEGVLADQDALPSCDRTTVGVDLREDWPSALTSAGFDPTAPTAWLAEGLLLYLAADEAEHLLTAVGQLSAPGSRLSLEFAPTAGNAMLARVRAIPVMSDLTKLWKGGLGHETRTWLEHHSWDTHTHDREDAAHTYGRTPPEQDRGGFLIASRRETSADHVKSS